MKDDKGQVEGTESSLCMAGAKWWGGGVGGALLLSHVAIRSELVPVALVSWCPGITEGGLASLGINLTLCISYLTK